MIVENTEPEEDAMMRTGQPLVVLTFDKDTRLDTLEVIVHELPKIAPMFEITWHTNP